MTPRAETLSLAGGRAVAFLKELKEALDRVAVTDGTGAELALDAGLAAAVKILLECRARSGRLLLIGNGGSATIASHHANDFWRLAGIEAMAFNDAALLTCVANDDGFENVFARPISAFGRRGDVLAAVSSSGASPNILNGVEAAREKEMTVVTLSGFEPDNPLRAHGAVNFHVPDRTFGIVEASHLALLHAILDAICATGAKA